MIQEFSSKNTSINKSRLPHVFSFMIKNHFLSQNAVIFDIGAGKYGNTKNAVEMLGVTYLPYDKYNIDKNTNDKTLSILKDNKADISVISNVLNVIKEVEIQKDIILLAINNTKTNGKVLIKVYEGDKSGKGRETKKDCWQENKVLSEYLKIIPSYEGLIVQMKGGIIFIEILS